MTEGLTQRERRGAVAPARVTAGGDGKQQQRSGRSIGRRGEINLNSVSAQEDERLLTPWTRPAPAGGRRLTADTGRDSYQSVKIWQQEPAAAMDTTQTILCSKLEILGLLVPSRGRCD